MQEHGFENKYFQNTCKGLVHKWGGKRILFNLDLNEFTHKAHFTLGTLWWGWFFAELVTAVVYVFVISVHVQGAVAARAGGEAAQVLAESHHERRGARQEPPESHAGLRGGRAAGRWRRGLHRAGRLVAWSAPRWRTPMQHSQLFSTKQPTPWWRKLQPKQAEKKKQKKRARILFQCSSFGDDDLHFMQKARRLAHLLFIVIVTVTTKCPPPIPHGLPWVGRALRTPKL